MSFTEGFVDADGFRVRYMQDGVGDALIHIHGAGGLRLTPAHELLAQQRRVIALDVPGFGASPANESSQSMAGLGRTMNRAVAELGISRYVVWGTSFGGKVAMFMALDSPEAMETVVLESSAAIRPEGHVRQRGTPEQNAAMLYAHPERQPAPPPVDAAVLQKQEALVARVMGPNRDPALEDRLGEIEARTLVLFGTEDKMIPPEMGSIYKERMTSCNFILVYDAGHAIAADRPEAFASLVGDFLQRQEQFIVSAESTVIHP
ncbi:MAG TPA: alpha/beta hydrolase [Chloroflexota bacterium]|nr:alpha/beta hydrolase [Chloroflexota bacterium]